jgi:hypothetical protein
VKDRIVVAFGLFVFFGFFGVLCVLPHTIGQAPKPKDPVVRPRPVADPKAAVVADKRDIPGEGTLYVWQRPVQGLQTLLVLKVIDGETFEAAYLVPVRVRLKGVVGKERASTDLLDKLIGGRLVNTSLLGVDDKGVQLADVHFGAVQKDATLPHGWISDWLKKK